MTTDGMEYDDMDYDEEESHHDTKYDDESMKGEHEGNHAEDVSTGWDMMWGDGASSLVASGIIAVTTALAF